MAVAFTGHGNEKVGGCYRHSWLDLIAPPSTPKHKRETSLCFTLLTHQKSIPASAGISRTKRDMVRRFIDDGGETKHTYYMDHSLREQVTNLIQRDPCNKCLRGKARDLEVYLRNFNRLSPKERQICIYTSLSLLLAAEEARPRRIRSAGVRQRIHYFVPFVGRVCKATFLHAFHISESTLVRYKSRVRSGWLVVDD
jgi:hypothetical protein